MLGKAFSGSPEGYKSLRNTLGVTTLDLTRAGAVATGLGGISLDTQVKVDKARNAVEKIVQLKSGDAIEKQSKTLFGTLSNLGDAVTRASAGIGSALIPVITAAAGTTTKAIEVFEKLPQGLKATAAFSGVAALAITATTSVTLLFTAAVARSVQTLISMGGSLLKVGADSAVASAGMLVASSSAKALESSMIAAAAASKGVGVASSFAGAAPRFAGAAAVGAEEVAAIGLRARAAAGFSALSSSITGASEAALAFIGIPVAATLATAAGVAVVGAAGIAQMRSETDQLNATITEQTKLQVSAIGTFRQFKDIAEKVTGATKGFSEQGTDANKFLREFGQAMAGLTPVDVQKRLEDTGHSVDDVKQSIEKAKIESEALKQKIQTLTEAQAAYQKQQAQKPAFIQRSALDDAPPPLQILSDGEAAALEQVKIILGSMGLSMESLTSKTKEFNDQYNRILSSIGVGQVFIDRSQKAAVALDAGSKSAETFSVFLREATRTDNVDALNKVMGQLQSRISEVGASLASVGVPVGNVDALRNQLLDGSADAKTAVKALLGLMAEQEQLARRIADQQTKIVQEEVHQVEIVVERKKLARNEDFRDEIDHLKRIVAAKKLSADEELSILQKIDSLETQVRTRKIDTAKTALGAVAQQSRESIEQLGATGTATANQTVKTLEGVITNLQRWKAENKALIAQTPQLKADYASTLLGFQQQLDRARLSVPKELLEKQISQARAFGTEAVSAEQKLSATRQGLDLLQQLELSGQIRSTQDKKRLQEQINDLRRHELDLQKQATREADAQLKITNDLKRGALDQQLQILQAEQQVEGKDNTSKIKQKNQEILASKIEQIREQEQSEIDSGASVEQAKSRTEIRITQFKNQEVLRRIALEQQETRAVDEAAKEQEAIRNRLAGLKSSRFGGAGSPLISVEELGLQSQLQFSFTPKYKTEVPGRVADIRRRVETDISEGARLRTGPTTSEAGATGGAVAAAEAGGSGPIYKDSVVIQSMRFDDDPEVREAAFSLKRAVSKSAKTALITGPGAPRGVR